MSQAQMNNKYENMTSWNVYFFKRMFMKTCYTHKPVKQLYSNIASNVVYLACCKTVQNICHCIYLVYIYYFSFNVLTYDIFHCSLLVSLPSIDVALRHEVNASISFINFSKHPLHKLQSNNPFTYK